MIEKFRVNQLADIPEGVEVVEKEDYVKCVKPHCSNPDAAGAWAKDVYIECELVDDSKYPSIYESNGIRFAKKTIGDPMVNPKSVFRLESEL